MRNPAIDVLLFDLDGTLYDQECGYEDHIHSNIFKFMAESTGGKFDEISTIERAQEVWKPIFQKYNLTKRGLLGEGYVFDTVAYDKFIRQGASLFIRKDPELRHFLESLSCPRKVIFTNAPESSANEILELLGVSDLFEAVLGSNFLHEKVCKPEFAAFEEVLKYLGNVQPESICFFEDSFINLKAGKALGFKTVFISSSTLHNEGRSRDETLQFDAVVENKVGMSLKHQLSFLWD